MNITWFGDGCFVIKSSYPKKIVFNPNEKYLNQCDFNSDMIFLFPSTDVNIRIPQIYLKRITIINSINYYEDDKISINNFKSYKDNLNGLKRGENYIYSIIINNLKIVHLGLLGSLPNDDIIDSINKPDILFIPVGGNLCISGYDANKLVNLLEPKFIVPMNYKSSVDKFYYDSLHGFIINQKNVVKLNSSTFHISDMSKYTHNSTLVFNEA